MRDVDPACLQARAGDALDARQRLRLDRTERGEVDGRNGGQRAATRSGSRASWRRHEALDEGLDIIVRDPALETVAGDAREIDAQLACKLAHAGTRMRAGEARLVDGRQVGTQGR